MVPKPKATHPVHIWNTAIAILDKSEIVVRDTIEREFADIAGAKHLRVGEAMTATAGVMKKITVIRTEAIKQAFRHIRDNLQ
jgi:hypothetical protein